MNVSQLQVGQVVVISYGAMYGSVEAKVVSVSEAREEVLPSGNVLPIHAEAEVVVIDSFSAHHEEGDKNSIHGNSKEKGIGWNVK